MSKTRRILRNMDEESVQQVQTAEALKPSGEDCRSVARRCAAYIASPSVLTAATAATAPTR